MDVRCEKCQTVYEFDDAKVTTAGVTVKCTQCGNLFKVRRRAVITTAPNISRPSSPAPPQQLSPFAPASTPPPQSVSTPPPLPLEPPERQRTTTQPRGAPGPVPMPPPVPARKETPPRGVPTNLLTPTSGMPVGSPTPARGVPAVPDERVWLVRIASNGEVKRFRELTTLQQWIVEKRVSRDDEISRTGDNWKRLGGIAELASFFHVVEQAEARGTSPSLDPRAYAPTISPEAFGDKASRPPPSMPLAGALSGPTSARPSANPFAETRQERGLQLGSLPPPALASDDDEDFVPRRGLKPATMAGLAAIAVVVLGGLYLGVFKRDALKKLFAGEETRGGEAYRKGREYFMLDADDSLRMADQQLQRAHGADEQNAQPVAALAEVNATWAGYLRDDSKDAEAAKQAGKADELKKLAQAHLDDAKRYANEAMTLSPEDPDVNRAMAAYLLVDGANAAQVEGYLKKCDGKRPEDAEAAYLRGALALRDGRGVDARIALDQANRLNQAKTQHDLLRADYALARLAMSLGRRDEARGAAERVLDVNARHDRARALVELATAPPVAPVAVVDAGVAPVGAQNGTPPPNGTVKPPHSEHGDEEEPHGSFESLLAQGNKLLTNGRTKDAQKVFEKALTLQPDDVDALNGLGYCYLDTEHFVAATEKFKQVLARAGQNGDAMIGMAEAYKMRGDRPKALEFYKKYVAELPGGTKARMAQTNVRELEEALKQGGGQVHDAPPIEKQDDKSGDPPP